MALPPRYKSGPKKGQFMSKKARRAKTAGKRRKAKKVTKAKKKARRKGTKTMAKKKRRSRRRAKFTNLMTRAKVFGAGAAYGYAKEKTQWLAVMDKLPGVDTVGRDAVAMVGAHLVAKNIKGTPGKVADYLATALAGHVGVKFGLGGMKVDAMKGPSAASDELLGDIDPADFLDSEPEA